MSFVVRTVSPIENLWRVAACSTDPAISCDWIHMLSVFLHSESDRRSEPASTRNAHVQERLLTQASSLVSFMQAALPLWRLLPGDTCRLQSTCSQRQVVHLVCCVACLTPGWQIHLTDLEAECSQERGRKPSEGAICSPVCLKICCGCTAQLNNLHCALHASTFAISPPAHGIESGQCCQTPCACGLQGSRILDSQQLPASCLVTNSLRAR